MSLAEPGVLGDAGDDLGQVMAEYVAYRLLGVDQLHIVFLPNKKEVPSSAVPPAKRVQYPLWERGSFSKTEGRAVSSRTLAARHRPKPLGGTARSG